MPAVEGMDGTMPCGGRVRNRGRTCLVPGPTHVSGREPAPATGLRVGP